MRVSILTISDSVASGKSEDRSGPAVIARCKELGWTIVSSAVLRGRSAAIEAFLKETADSQAADVILTTGGTGLGPRDVTPEATMAVVERLIPGFPEQMRAEGRKKTDARYFRAPPRGFAARPSLSICREARKGAVESLDAIADLLPHAVADLAWSAARLAAVFGKEPRIGP